MINKAYFFFLVSFLLSYGVMGQSKRDIFYKEKIAQESFNSNSFNKSLQLYLELEKLNPDSKAYFFPIGVSYMNLLKVDKALPYLEKCLAHASKYPPILYYYSAKAYHFKLELNKAIENYEKFKTVLINQKKRRKERAEKEKMIAEIEREIGMCNYGKELMNNPIKLEIKNMGNVINSVYPDYGAVLSADESSIVFTSTRPGTTGGQIDNSDGLGLYYEDIYTSFKTDTGWSIPKNIGTPINTNGNDASIALSADGQKLLFYRSTKENFISSTSGDIYISTLKGTHWGFPEKLPEQINSKGWEPSASLSSDGRVLIFTSNREGGLGGTDLYMVRKLPNGEWAMPFNLGSKINTPYDEDSPFIHPDGKTLYFSSKGHETMGGFDIFSSSYDKETKEWSAPKNVGYPINTAQDDIQFAWSADGKKIYFSSIRPEGYGDKDIYYASVEKEEANLIVLKGIISDSLTHHPIETNIKVFDKQSKELIGIFNSNSESGKYLVVLPEGKTYTFSITAQKYADLREDIAVPKLGGFKILKKDMHLFPKVEQK